MKLTIDRAMIIGESWEAFDPLTGAGGRLARVLDVEDARHVVRCANLYEVAAPERWSAPDARLQALTIMELNPDVTHYVLCGRRVEAAFTQTGPWAWWRAHRLSRTKWLMAIPHPSGSNRYWNNHEEDQYRPTLLNFLGHRYKLRVWMDTTRGTDYRAHDYGSGWDQDALLLLPEVRDRYRVVTTWNPRAGGWVLSEEPRLEPEARECLCTSDIESGCDEMDDSWACSRPRGHTGEHVACYTSSSRESDHRRHTWPVSCEEGARTCASDRNWCGHESDDGWYCSRAPGHSGNHIACNTTEHNIASWPRAAAEWPRSCSFCAHGCDSYCTRSLGDGNVCTRAPGHEGPHVA